jgi:ribonuclease HI
LGFRRSASGFRLPALGFRLDSTRFDSRNASTGISCKLEPMPSQSGDLFAEPKSTAHRDGKRSADPAPDSSSVVDAHGHHTAAHAAYTAHVDGGARGNPGPAGYGVAIKDAAGKPVAELSEYLGHQTNNYAEYSGLIAALRYACEHKIAALKVVSDSELMVRQMKGIYKVKHPELRKLHHEAQTLVKRLEHFEIRHALREHNQVADRLANEAMDRGKLSGAKAPGK